MRVGSQIGDILLDIANEKILKGDLDGAIRTYTESLHGFSEKYAKKVITNQVVLLFDEHTQEAKLSDDADIIKLNQTKILDWQGTMEDLVSVLREAIYDANINIDDITKLRIYQNDYSLFQIFDDANKSKVANIGAKQIANILTGDEYNDDWYEFIDETTMYGSTPDEHENIIITLVAYIQSIKELYESYMSAAKLYDICKMLDVEVRVPFLEKAMEDALDILIKFSNPNEGYHHPSCDEEVSDYKDDMLHSIRSTSFGKEMDENGILRKNPLDKYDAAWVAPDGSFYGMYGNVRDMLHFVIADKMYPKMLKEKMEKEMDPSMIINLNSEAYLTDHSWVKIHHDEAYCLLAITKDDKTDKMLWVPTKEQIDVICTYMDTHHNGRFYTEAGGNVLARIDHKEPYKTSAIRQMDEFMIRKVFEIC